MVDGLAVVAIEYLRAFLVGRVGWSTLNGLLVISGAFGLFRRDLLEAAGGYRRDTVGEDVELVIRLHRRLRERKADYRIVFVPDPVCWTEVPETLRGLARQRRRWQRGLAEALWRHRAVAGNPRYGLLGLVVIPYFLVFELAGPLVEATGPPVTGVAFATGELSLAYLLGFLAVSVAAGMFLSITALSLEELSFRRHPRAREIGRLLAFCVLENLGYRQLVDIWRSLALADAVRRSGEWGLQSRRGFRPGAAAGAG